MAGAERIAVVTGGAGFIGSHLTDALVAHGIRTRVLDNFTTGRRELVNRGAELFEADIGEPSSLESIFAEADSVFHLAALPRVPLSIAEPVQTHLVNVVGTLNVLMAARKAGVRRLVYSGSSSVYGDQAELPLRETMKPRPRSPYALQKLTGEEYTRLFHQLYGMGTLSLRYFNVYGPRMASEGAYVTAIGVFLRARREGRSLTIHGDGEQTRDFTHVSDVVRANLLAMDCAIADGCALNIGAGRRHSINQIATMIGGARIYEPTRAGDVRHTLADYTAAQQILGWHPQMELEEGIVELLHDDAGCVAR